METSRAREITAAIVAVKMFEMGLGDPCKLPECSLEDMLQACRIVGGPAGKEQNPDGSTTLYTTVDPRGVALAYVAEHFEPVEVIEGLNLTVDKARSLRDWLTSQIDAAEENAEEAPHV